MTQDRNGSNTRNTGANLAERGRATRFVKGDPRINRKGRPKSFDEVRALAQELAHESQNGRPAIINLLREWRDSREPSLRLAFVAYAFGKVPDKLETTGLENKPTLILHFDHERGVTSPDERKNGSRIPA